MSVTIITYSQDHKISRVRGIIKPAAALLRSFGHNLMSKLVSQFAGLNDVYQKTLKLTVPMLSFAAGSAVFLP
jgi:hypothetical protein